jgi:hypothetical protein
LSRRKWKSGMKTQRRELVCARYQTSMSSQAVVRRPLRTRNAIGKIASPGIIATG